MKACRIHGFMSGHYCSSCGMKLELYQCADCGELGVSPLLSYCSRCGKILKVIPVKELSHEIHPR